jgi:hypothetical protein
MPRLLTSFSKRMEGQVNLTSSALNVETQGTCPGFVLRGAVGVGGEAGVEAVVEMGASNVERQVTFLENVQRVEVDLMEEEEEEAEGVEGEEVEADFSDNFSAKFALFFSLPFVGSIYRRG